MEALTLSMTLTSTSRYGHVEIRLSNDPWRVRSVLVMFNLVHKALCPGALPRSVPQSTCASCLCSGIWPLDKLTTKDRTEQDQEIHLRLWPRACEIMDMKTSGLQCGGRSRRKIALDGLSTRFSVSRLVHCISLPMQLHVLENKMGLFYFLSRIHQSTANDVQVGCLCCSINGEGIQTSPDSVACRCRQQLTSTKYIIFTSV